MKPKCKVEECDRPSQAKELCGLHYSRLRRNGTLELKVAQKAAFRWLYENVFWEGDDCLIWPHQMFPSGYAAIYIGNQKLTASRIMCFLAHGRPPHVRYHASHTCHNGHNGCVNPGHLEWATASENCLAVPKERRVFKHSPETVSKITSLIPTQSNMDIAACTGVSPRFVQTIRAQSSGGQA